MRTYNPRTVDRVIIVDDTWYDMLEEYLSPRDRFSAGTEHPFANLILDTPEGLRLQFTRKLQED